MDWLSKVCCYHNHSIGTFFIRTCSIFFNLLAKNFAAECNNKIYENKQMKSQSGSSLKKTLSLWMGSFTLICQKNYHQTGWAAGKPPCSRSSPPTSCYIRNMIFIIETDSVPKDFTSRLNGVHFFFSKNQNENTKRSFLVDNESNTFLKDGKPFQYLSGSVHYARIPPEYWEDRMKKIRAGGFNAIQFYVEWKLHEPRPGKYNFSGSRNIEKFIQLAQSNDLLVILRPGPYIDGERDMGGLPSWLLENGTIRLRKSDPKFTDPVENEYGSFGCDTSYLSTLRESIYSNVGGPDKVLLFTTDGASVNLMRCGYVPETLSTVDFGPGSPPKSMEGSLNQSQLFRPRGPLVNSEFYTGWLDHWGRPHAKGDTKVVSEALDWLLGNNVSVNLYMVHGGTSFGFEAGANGPPFAPNPTSYDYDAPISEAGDMTAKYEAIKAVASKYFTIPKIHVQNSTKINHAKGKFQKNPLSFEDLNQESGFVLYETFIPRGRVYSSPVTLQIASINDRGNVFLNEKPLGVLTRMFDSPKSISILGLKGGEKIMRTGWKIECDEGVFDILKDKTPFDISGWSKGIVFLNGFNLGRYWPVVGPQETLYLPGSILICNGVNRITLFEQDGAPENRSEQFITLVDQHRIDGPTPHVRNKGLIGTSFWAT
ncbi:GLB1 [Lepeophtheirus salmonis]|uniref:GLB1 n=1 Tax=Lepeophtheirus salmonis TaxID=72036 RepID=A0A7R8D646_LEPSM|nr:GLB1 [Lepeophtheirus salmonis]CAF3041702.1 GLB1 [Lepeophtheirus salmonis]